MQVSDPAPKLAFLKVQDEDDVVDLGTVPDNNHWSSSQPAKIIEETCRALNLCSTVWEAELVMSSMNPATIWAVCKVGTYDAN